MARTMVLDITWRLVVKPKSAPEQNGLPHHGARVVAIPPDTATSAAAAHCAGAFFRIG